MLIPRKDLLHFWVIIIRCSANKIRVFKDQLPLHLYHASFFLVFVSSLADTPQLRKNNILYLFFS